MAGLPSGNIDATNLDQSTDSPDAARANLFELMTKFNQLMAAFAQPSGLATLDSFGRLFGTQLPAPVVLGAQLSGTGLGVNADTLGTLDAGAYILVDGTRAMYADTIAFGVSRNAAANNAITTPLAIHALNASATAGFGVELLATASNAAGTPKANGSLSWAWTTATGGSEESDLIFGVSHSGAVVEGLRLRGQRILEFTEISATSAPPSGARWLYATAAGLAMRDHAGTEVVIGATGAGDHHTLTNLLSGDDHTQYFRTDGSRVLTADLQVGAFGVLTTDLGSDHAAPVAGKTIMYSRGGQVYYRQPGGTVIGPLLGGGVTAHSDLTGLTTGDDHTQYLLRNPTADVVMNTFVGDFDLHWRGTADSFLLAIDSGNNVVGIGDPGTTAFGKLIVRTAISAQPGIYAATSGGGVCVFATATTTGTCFQGAVETGQGLFLHRISSTSVAGPLIDAYESGTVGSYIAAFRQKVAGAPALVVKLHDTYSALAVEAAEVVVNDGGRGDVDFRVAGAGGSDHLLFASSGGACVSVNGLFSTGRFNVYGGSVPAIYAFSDIASVPALSLFVDSGGATTFATVLNAVNNGAGIIINTQRMIGLEISKQLSGLSPSGDAARFKVLDPTDTGACLRTTQEGTGDHFVGQTSALAGGTAIRVTTTGVLYLGVQASDPPAPPDTSTFALYFKSGGLYTRDHSGTVVGPIT